MAGESGGAAAAAAAQQLRNVFVSHFRAHAPFQQFCLGRDAARVATEPNAGGTSIVSESLSVEYFARRFCARNVVTEMEVKYRNPNWKKVDYICDIYGQRVGVSVTRAMSYPNPALFSHEEAHRLLCKKLCGLVVARQGVSLLHSFCMCVLHVWCETRRTAKMLQAEYNAVAEDLEVAEDVIMVLTVAEGGAARPIFYESRLKDCDAAGQAVTFSRERHPWWWLVAKARVP
eukprot:SM000318S12224  [mRNA]  locus=s318:82405:84183:- [translate_table: standard]